MRSVIAANRLLVQNISVTVMLRGIAVMVSIAAMPAYLNYFADSTVLGTWFTILSLLNFLSYFDFGVGNGLRNNIVKAMATKDVTEARNLVTAGYLLAFGVVFFIAVMGYAAIRVVDWGSIFTLDDTQVLPDAFETTLVLVLFTVCAQLFLRNAISILYGLQKMILANVPTLITSIILLVFLMFGGTGNVQTDLLRLAVVYLVATVVPLVIVHVVLFRFIIPGTHPGLKTTRTAVRRVGGLGLGFFSIQVALLVVNSTDQILITIFFDSADVVDYQIYLRVFTLFTMVFQLLTQPFWSAVTAADARGDKRWITRAAKMLYLVAALGTLLGIILVPALQFILDVWLGAGRIVVVEWHAMGFVLLISVQMLMYAGTTIANGTGGLRTQIIWAPLSAILKFPLAFLLAAVLDVWVAIVVAQAISLVPLMLAQTRNLKKEGYL